MVSVTYTTSSFSSLCFPSCLSFLILSYLYDAAHPFLFFLSLLFLLPLIDNCVNILRVKSDWSVCPLSTTCHRSTTILLNCSIWSCVTDLSLLSACTFLLPFILPSHFSHLIFFPCFTAVVASHQEEQYKQDTVNYLHEESTSTWPCGFAEIITTSFHLCTPYWPRSLITFALLMIRHLKCKLQTSLEKSIIYQSIIDRWFDIYGIYLFIYWVRREYWLHCKLYA